MVGVFFSYSVFKKKKKQMSSISKALKYFTLISTCVKQFGCMHVYTLCGCLVLELQQAGVRCHAGAGT